MLLTVKQVAGRTGVSVRTLHYYDEIGLLPPTRTTEAGYRLYGEEALERLQQILFLKELDFPLEEIRAILDDPSFDKTQAMRRHRELLLLKRARLDRLIRLVENNLKGESEMDFQSFDQSEIEAARRQYAKETEERWGQSEAYRQSQERTGRYSKEDWAKIESERDRIFQAFAAQRCEAPESPAVQRLVGEWKAHISNHFYDCTDEILAGLGEMYTADPRFTQNIDRFGEGTAQLIRDAIRVYCGK